MADHEVADIGVTPEREQIAIVESRWKDEVLYYETLYEKTHNPMYAWRVLALYCAYKVPLSFYSGNPGPRANLELPVWCCKYFLSASQELESLAKGDDIREELPRLDGPPRNSVDATTAAALIPLALGLAGRQGKSMLFDYRSRKMTGFEASLYDTLRENGLSPKDATEILLDRTGLNDERSLRKRFAKSDVRLTQGLTNPQSLGRNKGKAK